LIVPLGHAQLPLTHCCPPPHVFPHDPQLLPSVFVLVHAVPQRFGLAVVGQAQVPPWQVSAAGHAWAHVPQLALSLVVLVHVDPHNVGLAEIGQAHVPAVQLCADGHTWLQAPQLALSVLVLVQALPQKLGLAVLGHTHVPDWHASPEPQTLPHVPQLLGSLVGVVHVPLQLVWPDAQPLVQAYVDPEVLHTGVAPEHPAPQPEQFVELPRLVLQPVPVLPQSANPAAHWYEHVPAVHARPVVPTCGSFEQLVPQAPQLLTSVPRTLTHVPLQFC